MVLATHGAPSGSSITSSRSRCAAAKNTEAKLFGPPPSSMFRRPRDQLRVLGQPGLLRQARPGRRCSRTRQEQAERLKLKITDATGREVREITVPALRKRIDSACWDLRPADSPPFPGAAAGEPGRLAAIRTPPVEPFRLRVRWRRGWRRRRVVRRRRRNALRAARQL
jgi:hypothetical protein